MLPSSCLTCKAFYALNSHGSPTSSEPQITRFTKRLVTLSTIWWETGKASVPGDEKQKILHQL